MAKTACKLVAYYRVSTDKQGKSGLGLEGQEAAIAAYVAASGCTLVASYTEVESGKDSDRPELAKALAHAKRAKATLVVAKMDRLSRNVHFLSGLMESGVEFTACDNPNANRLTIHILAAVAEDEARRISERTKAALAAYKARQERGDVDKEGKPLKPLGGKRENAVSNLDKAARAKGSKQAGAVARDKAIEAYAEILPMIQEMKAGGSTLAAIADRLNELGHTTRKGAAWTATQVKRIIDRSAE